MENKKRYFASDVHLGAPYIKDPKKHETRFVAWLDAVRVDADEIFLMGDIFDFWWEYKRVVPRGFTRLLGKLSEITDSGIPVHFFIGNHDIWVKDYLQNECGLIMHFEPETVERNGFKLFLAHGDGLYDPSLGFKLLRSAFHSTFLQKLFETFVHPDLAVKIGKYWSGKSRMGSDQKHASSFLGEDKEHLVLFSKAYLKNESINFFIYGHRHIALDLMLQKDSRIVILGDWISQFTYAEMDGEKMMLKTFEDI